MSETKTTLTDADREALADIFEERIRKLSKDGEFTKVVYKDSYDEMSKHALDGLSLWIGRKVVVFVSGVIFISVLSWALLTRSPR